MRTNVEKMIADIAFLENLYALPDERPFPPSQLRSGSSEPDDACVESPEPSLWQQIQRIIALLLDKQR
jgi:hypothetical protein